MLLYYSFKEEEMKSKKELSPNAIYDYAVYLQEKGELTNKKRDILFDIP